MAELFVLEISDHFIISILPPVIVLIPIVGSIVIGLIGLKNTGLRNIAAAVTAGATLYFCIELFLLVLRGYKVYYSLPPMAGLETGFAVDLTGAVFALFSSVVWFLATLASLPYMKHEGRQTRYYVFLILSLGGCVGVFLCGDFLSLFLFFELMTLASYALVVHNQSAEAMKAGNTYLYLGVIGGLVLLVGIIMLNSLTGSAVITPSLQDIVLTGKSAALIALFMIAGFGVKAGMIPLHIWLPQAHPVAPSPASGLLSGIMIKTGAYGIIRVVNLLYTPSAELAQSGLWNYTANIGHVVIWIGIMTMLLAALMAILQNNAKRLLAYSSVSQMGYILMGVGAAAYLGYDGAIGFGGFSYHIINHAFFKSGLFILFGIIYARLHEIRLDHLGGLWKKFPFTFAAFAACAAGITGIPGFNGYVSKTLLHHAIVEAFEHHHLWDLWLAEKLFMLTSALTVCYITKIFLSLFWGKEPEELRSKLGSGEVRETWLERIVALVYLVVVLFLGLQSPLVLKRVIEPMAEVFTYSEHHLHHLAEVGVWTLHDLYGIAVALVLGIGLYILFRRKELFALKPPPYLSVEYSLYRPLTAVLGTAFTRTGKVLDDNLNFGFHGAPVLLTKFSDSADYVDNKFMQQVGNQITAAGAGSFNRLHGIWMNGLKYFFTRLIRFLKKVFMMMFKFDYSAKGDRLFQTVNISNIDLDLWIMLFVIGAILATSLLFLL